MAFFDGLPEELIKKIKLEDLELAFTKSLAELSGGNNKEVECKISKIELLEHTMRGSIKMEIVFSRPMIGDLTDPKNSESEG